MDISIILVSYNTKELTRDCIKSIYEKTKDIEYEIFVVDNNSHDGSADMVEQEFPDVKLIRNPDNRGFGAANNVAIKQANGKYIFCLNTDTLLINNAIKIMFDFMENKENQNIAVCGGVLHDIDQKPIHSGGLFPCITNILLASKLRYLFKSLHDKRLGNKLRYEDIEYVTGADILFRKNVLDEIGLFDENYFMYFEESDLCYRIKQQGYDIKIVQDAKIIHLEGKSSKENIKKLKWHKFSEQYFFKKHKPHQVFLLKTINIIIYFISAYLLYNHNHKEILSFILRGCEDE